MKSSIRFFTVLLAMAILVLFSVTAFSDDVNNGYCGKDGDNLSWKIEDGVLTISGEGDMEDYDYSVYNFPPWYSLDYSSVVIKAGVESIGSCSFSNNNQITSISIPSSVKAIGRFCFENCTGLIAVSIPEDIESINDYAFMGCTGILEMNVPDDLAYLGIYAFSGCTSLTHFAFPASIKAIPQGSLKNCSEIRDVTIPDSVEKIDSSAFSGCKMLKTVIIPENVKSIKDGVFQSCENLETVYWNAIDADSKKTVFSNAGKSVGGLSIIFGNSVKKIPAGICYIKKLANGSELDYIRNITIGNSVEEIGAEAFRECRLLKSITIPDSVKIIRESAFNETYLDDLTLGNGLETIEDLAFKNLKVKEVVLPESVINVAPGAFGRSVEKITIGSKLDDIKFLSNMPNLKEVQISSDNTKYTSDDGVVLNKQKTAVCFYPPAREENEYAIPSGITVICERCFNGNKKIEKVIAPRGLKKIESNTFMDCSQLKEITLPVSLKEIGMDSFRFTEISDVYYEGSESDRNTISFLTDDTSVENATWHYNCHLEGDDPVPVEPFESLIIKGNSSDRKKTYDYRTTVTFTAIIPDGSSAEWFIDDAPAGNGSTLKVENKTSDYTVKVIVTAKDGTRTVDTETIHIKNGFFDIIIWFFKHLFNPDAYVINQ